MHKRLVNECLISLEIQTDGPILIRSGETGTMGSDMAPVKTSRNGTPEPYLPGSSLKGVLRSHSERIARTLCHDPDNWKLGACDPFRSDQSKKDWAKVDGSCSIKLQFRKDISSQIAYKDSCPVCKLYGNTSLLGRFTVYDAYLKSGTRASIERRDMVGIDRFTGGSAGTAKFDAEVVTEAAFETTIRLTNFELWQLGLVAFVLRDLGEGLVPIGGGKSRGLGRVKASAKSIRVNLVSNCLPSENENRIFGMYALEQEDDRNAYGYWQDEAAGVTLEGHTDSKDMLGLRKQYALEGDAVTALWRKAAPLAMQLLQGYSIPERMRREYLETLNGGR